MESRKNWLVTAAVLAVGCGGGESEDTTLDVTWTFESGDCASHGVETVSVGWAEGGGAEETKEFSCEDGGGNLTQIAGPGASYTLRAEGIDPSGIVRVESFGQTATFPDGTNGFGPEEITLRPKAGAVTVTWEGCPRDVILPYFITIYEPGTDAELGAKVGEAQEGCGANSVTVERVPPGDYIVEVDSRAVTPAVYGTEEVTVVAGETAEVTVPVP